MFTGLFVIGATANKHVFAVEQNHGHTHKWENNIFSSLFNKSKPLRVRLP